MKTILDKFTRDFYVESLIEIYERNKDLTEEQREIVARVINYLLEKETV